MHSYHDLKSLHSSFSSQNLKYIGILVFSCIVRTNHVCLIIVDRISLLIVTNNVSFHAHDCGRERTFIMDIVCIIIYDCIGENRDLILYCCSCSRSQLNSLDVLAENREKVIICTRIKHIRHVCNTGVYIIINNYLQTMYPFNSNG